MQKNYYVYDKPELNITIYKLPIWFKETSYEGDEKKGTILFHSYNDYDEIYGSNAKIEINIMNIYQICGKKEYIILIILP